MISVLIVDDMSLLRDSFKMIIETDKEISVVGLASNGMEALQKFVELLPDVVLMDLSMPIYSGLDAIKDIKNIKKSSKILVLSVEDDEKSIYTAFNNGADGYVFKNIKASDLIDIIKKIHNGESFFKDEAFCFVKNEIENISLNNNAELTNREREVFKLVSMGLTNEQIALCLGISCGRIKNIVADLISKFMVQNRTQLAIIALKGVENGYKNI